MKSVKKRDAFHHGNLKAALVRSTVQLLQTREPGTLSLREIARVAGVTTGAPYHHFAARADLLLAVALEGWALLGAALATADGSEAPPAERLRRRLRAYVAFGVSHLAHYRVMFGDELREAQDAAAYEAVARAGFEGLVDAVSAVRPRLRRVRARTLALAVWSAAHGAILLHGARMVAPLLDGTTGVPPRPLDALVEPWVALVLHG
jgi:AcrR family transcriptional regulator